MIAPVFGIAAAAAVTFYTISFMQMSDVKCLSIFSSEIAFVFQLVALVDSVLVVSGWA